MTQLMCEQTKSDPAQLPWPEDGLESVPYCPACGDGNRSLQHEGLADYVFFCAPGRWNLYACYGCGSIYLDSRPTLATIHLAYTDYYTHTFDQATVLEKSTGMSKIRRALGNGYRNWRFGGNLEPSSRLGIVAAYVMPSWRQHVDRLHRHLPRYQPGGRLLDVGCGNGDFLSKAQTIGWNVQGLDPDPNAVVIARRRGIEVTLGSLDQFDDKSDLFDVVTLSHVIEHVHDPEATLRDIFRLLKPGGRVWIDTPNADAYGHRLFGPYWLGLDPPRHLIIFTWDALERLLAEVGFGEVKRQVCTNNLGWLTTGNQDEPRAIINTEILRSDVLSRFKFKMQCIMSTLLVNINYRRSEFITLIAQKPK